MKVRSGLMVRKYREFPRRNIFQCEKNAGWYFNTLHFSIHFLLGKMWLLDCADTLNKMKLRSRNELLNVLD